MLKTAVIGAGVMGQNHIRVLKGISKLVAFCDTDGNAAIEIGRRFGLSYHPSVEELLYQEDIDAVVIATPTATHKAVALECIRNGKHVLVEKPLASNEADALEIYEAAKKEKVVLAVGHIERHNPAVAAVKRLLDEKAVGELISMSSKRVGPFPWRVKDVGAIIDLAVHDIDIARYLAGSDIARIYAAGGSKVHKMEDYATILLTFRNGVTASVEVNWLTPVKIRTLGITCTMKYLNIDYTNQSVDVVSSTVMDLDPANLSHIPIESDRRRICLKKEEPLKNELLDFLEAIEHGRPPLVSGIDGVMAVSAAATALKSLASGVAVDV